MLCCFNIQGITIQDLQWSKAFLLECENDHSHWKAADLEQNVNKTYELAGHRKQAIRPQSNEVIV